MNKHPLADCENCTLKDEPYVPSYGPQGQVRLAVCGEAPGREEARLRRPFVGASGKLLRQVLEHHGHNPEQTFFTNAVSCRPPENRTPTKSEMKCCSKRLQAEIKEKEVEAILAVGGSAAYSVLGSSGAISNLRVGPSKESSLFPGVKVVASFHPAACLRNGDLFPSLVSDVAKLDQTFQLKWEPPDYEVFDNEQEALGVIAELEEYRERLVVDIETAHDKDVAFEHPSHYELLCVGIGYKPNKVVVIERNALRVPSVRTALGDLLKRSKITCHNGKFDIQGLRQLNPDIMLHYDTMLASYAADERGGVHKLEYLSQEILGTPSWKKVMAKWPNYADAPADILDRYNSYDVSCTWFLEDYFHQSLGDSSNNLVDRLIRLSNSLVPMELEGIGVDKEYLSKIEAEWEGKLADLERSISLYLLEPTKKTIKKSANSWKQVKEALEYMGVITPSTNAAALIAIQANTVHEPSLKMAHDFVTLMLEYRKEQKIYGTYIKGAKQRLYQGKLYPTFLLHGTTSGRLSCRNPNLFNIPRGSSIRKMFVPEPGNVFVQGDYSQIEWRVVCVLAQEPFLQEVFSDPDRDIHSEVAQRVGVDRDMAKKIAHASNYGMGIPHLADLLGISINKAAKYMREFFQNVPKVVAWQKSIQHQLFNEHNDLVTPYGRRRKFYLITDENKKDIYKEALSFQPQSIASDICSEAMVELLEAGLKVRLSVYDSIMVECHPSEVEDVKAQMEHVMIEAGRRFSDYVPFTVDFKIGKSWGDLS